MRPFCLTAAQMEKVATAYALETGMDKEAIIGALAKSGLSLVKGMGNVGSKVARLPGQAAGGALKGTLKGAGKFAIKHPMGTLMAVGAVGTGMATAKKHRNATGYGRGVAQMTTEMRRQQKINPGHQWSQSSGSGLRW